MEPNANNRIEYIDALRGFTMILVIYHHIAFWCLDNIDFGYNEFFMRFRMPLFFFISGWLFFKVNRLWDKETINGILKKKFIVQIIPFLFFMLLYMYMFRGPDYQTTFESKYGFWFTYTLFQYFVIYIATEAIHSKTIYLSNNELRLFSFLLSGISDIIIVFTFFRKSERYISKSNIIGNVLQFIGRRTLDIYLIHFFVLPYHIHQIGTWPTISYKLLDLVMFLILAFWIIAISLLISSIIRLSPFLGHYLFGAKSAKELNQTDS